MNTEKRQRSDREATIVVVFLLLGLVFTLLGSTLAYFIWRGNITSINFTITRSFECSGDMGGTISSNQLAPASCTNSTYAIQREVTVNPVINSPGMSIYMDLWLNVTQIDEGLANSENFKYALTSSPNSCTDGVISSGTFIDKDSVELFSSKPFTYQIGLTQRPDLSQTYYLYVWLDAAEEDTATQGNNFTLTLGGQCTQGPYLTGGAAMLINKANPANVTSYTSGDTGEMYAFSQPETAQLGATTDYRYIGDSPNNYIEFNNETWRIIGVFDGKIKIIKDTPIDGYIKWDHKLVGVGSSESNYGSNDWTDSQLMYMLNPGDINSNLKTGYTYDGSLVRDMNNKIIYQRGCMPEEVDGSSTSYNCANMPWSLDSEALSQVADATYYLGGIGISPDLMTDEAALMEFMMSVTTQDAYELERGTEKWNDSRGLNWTGKVGLMYISDYYYTYAKGVDNSCYNSPFGCGYISGTPTTSWLFNSNYYQWAINPAFVYSVPESSSDVLSVLPFGHTDACDAGNDVDARPVVYLRSDIQIQGAGTNDGNIYKIVN